MHIQLLAADRIHEFTDVEKNVAPSFFEPRIIRAQEKYLVPVLGPGLYELVCEAYRAEQQPQPVPMPDRLDELHTALEPMLGQWIYWLSLPFLNVRTTNRGLDSSERAISPQSYTELKRTIQAEAEDRTNDLKKWLESRRNTYPEAPLYTPTRRRTGGIVL